MNDVADLEWIDVEMSEPEPSPLYLCKVGAKTLVCTRVEVSGVAQWCHKGEVVHGVTKWRMFS